MKYIKLYEEVNTDIKRGDYIVFDYSTDSDYDTFFRNNIGQVRNSGFSRDIPVDYENVPNNLTGFFNYKFGVYIRFLPVNKILFSSPNKKDVEAFLTANKYNL